jgi:O-antigen/teichoic acid export membrane protein
MVPNNLVYATNQNCDTFLVALFFGPISAGFYNVGKRVRLALQLVAGDPIKAIGLPTLAEIQGNPDRLRSGVIKSITVVCALCSPIFVGTSAVSDDAIRVIFGPIWEHSSPVLQFLSIGGLAMVLMTYNDNIFVLKGRPIWCLWLSLCYCILAITAMLICVELKVRCFALPFVLPYVIVLPFSYLLVCKRISIPPHEILRAILPGMSSAAFMFITVKFAGGYYPNYCHILRLLVLCVIGAFSYSLVLCGIWRGTTKLLLDTFRQVRHIKSPST